MQMYVSMYVYSTCRFNLSWLFDIFNSYVCKNEKMELYVFRIPKEGCIQNGPR